MQTTERKISLLFLLGWLAAYLESANGTSPPLVKNCVIGLTQFLTKGGLVPA
jgi:hypothetical protein